MPGDGFYKRHRKAVRWVVRLLILAVVFFLLLGGPLPAYAARLLPAMSPLAALSTSLAHRAWYVSLAWTLPAALLLGLALWKGRFFCRWICPLGTLYSIPSEYSLKRRFFPWRWNAFLFWFTLSAAAAGLPLILFLDPLSTFTRVGAMGQGAIHAMVWIPGALIPFMLLLSFVQPGIWCARLCPLGYFMEVFQLKTNIPKKLNRGRRQVLGGLALGVPAALLFRNIARAEKAPILPPGTRDLEHFSGTCMRCYACVDACPTGVLTVRKQGGIAEFCIPEMDFLNKDGAFCEQYCNACTQACPTGAIAALTLEEKQRRKIATAGIIRPACIAWEDRMECVACDEFCGYNAIEMRTGNDGIPKPVVNDRKCRGCGACQNICPAKRAGNAVAMSAILPHRVVTDEDEASQLHRGRRRVRGGRGS
jgi:ferredoxin